MQLDRQDIPEDLKEYIRKIRSENRHLRSRLKGAGIPMDAALEELPLRWQRHVRRLREDCARYRARYHSELRRQELEARADG